MKSTLHLAWRYVTCHWLRSGILAACIALVAFLPIAVEILVDHYEKSLTRRATETPLVVGAKGSRFDLLMNALYFKGRLKDRITTGDLDEIEADGRARVIPLTVEHTAQSYPVVGTSIDYFDYRSLRPAEGTLPLRIGDAVLGATVAAELGLGPGDRIISDPDTLFDLAASYPLRMRITGVLAKRDSPDDRAVFVDTRTAWVIAGIGHGHEDVAKREEWILSQDGEGHVRSNAAVVEFTEISPETFESFHFHRDPKTLPLTAGLVITDDAKSFSIVKARLTRSKTLQPLIPTEGVADLLDFVFQAKRFFDANLILVTVATGLFIALVVLLTVRVRERELETLFKIGASRATVVRLLATELALIAVAGFGAAVAAATIAARVAIRYDWLF